MFKSKSSSASNAAAETPKKLDSNTNGKSTTTSESLASSTNGFLPEVETGKEAKEKKDKSSWVKTIGMRTLRIRRSTDSRSSRLSLPGFSSLDRPGKLKKSKSGKNDDKDADANNAESNKPGVSLKDSLPDQSAETSFNDHVKVGNNANNGAVQESSPIPKIGVHLPEEKESTAASATAGENNSDKHDPARFLGEGLTFRGKLIGVLEVNGPRGDRICQEALSDLKMAVKAAGEHKQKVTVHVALDGLRIRDEKTGDCLYHHQVHKISFIAQDLTDTRAFGYIFGSPDTGHRFFGIKTEKSASQVVIAMRDLFQVVFDLKKKEIERAKQQLEMQQKFLATRAAEIAPTSSSKPEPKFSIAETYIEGACAAGTSSAAPNRTAPEVDLLNLEVELTSLQEGLDSIHHNLSDPSMPFRGSTTSISSDPMNPMPKRASVSSSNTNSTTPVPSAFGAISDPFGDSFDPFSDTSGGQHLPNFELGSSSKMRPTTASALTSPFTSDPFAQVDPFPDPKFQADSEFFNSDPFSSPSGPFSFSFPAAEAVNSNIVVGHGHSEPVNSNTSHTNLNGSSTVAQVRDSKAVKGPILTTSKDGWAASFEDNFVPESKSRKISTEKSHEPAEMGVFMDLDPLSHSSRPSVGYGPPSLGGFSESVTIQNNTSPLVTSKKSTDDIREPTTTRGRASEGGDLPNSFSTNFNPHNGETEYDQQFKSSISSFNSRSESPPNYSPPAPPRITGSSSPKITSKPSNTHVPFILPPANNSPRLSKKKSPQILKQITISESSSSPKTLPKADVRFGKQYTIDSSFHDDIPNLSPPPRPPHSGATISHTLKSTSSLASAVPRPTSGSSDKSKKLAGNVSIAGLPPEPPPRPIQSSISTSSHPMQLVSPPPLPPKKQTLSNTMSTPLKQTFNSKKIVSNTFSNRSLASAESNDLPLPLPLRKSHAPQENSNIANTSQVAGGRYAVPESNFPVTGSPLNSSRSTNMTKSYEKPDERLDEKMSMEQALVQVASLSLRDLADKLELPVTQLSTYTIQQLAHKLTELDLAKNAEVPVVSRQFAKSSPLRFDDDFSTASAPAKVNVQKDTGYDRYAVFRELALEDASGFSIVGSMSADNNSDEEPSGTLEKPFNSRESSSERTLQADDITEPTHMKSASFATALANTMDDVTDVNLSDDQENSKFMMEDDDDTDVGLVKNEWATFESNFDDKFARTALVKADGNDNDSPWDSDEAVKPYIAPVPIRSPAVNPSDQFDFKPFEKPSELPEHGLRKSSTGEERKMPTPERIRSPPDGHFQRQSSGSSRHSERSSGNNPMQVKASEYSDSGKNERRRHRKGSKDYERWDIDRERDGSGRYNRDREKDKDLRPDSRSSYTSIPRKYRNGDSEEEYSSSMRRGVKGRVGSGYGRRSKDYDREVELDDDDDDRSYVSHQSNYSGYSRRHRRYPSGKQHPHPRSGRRDRGASPDRYSNQESDDDSVEDENYSRKRDRDIYAREREYYERHPRRPRPNSGSSTGKRYSRESPRHSDSYYRRERRGRHRDPEEYDDSREFSDYSGEEEHSVHGHHHRRIRAKRSSNYRDRDQREPRGGGGHYYTNSPSWDSDSGPEGEKDVETAPKTNKSARRPNSGKERDREETRPQPRGSPEHYSSRRRHEKESSSRRYQSDLALNSKTNDSPKLSAFDFNDDFGASSLPSETVTKSRNNSVSSPLQTKPQDITIITHIDIDPVPVNSQEQETTGNAEPKNSHSPFEDDFVGETQSVDAKMSNGSDPTDLWVSAEDAILENASISEDLLDYSAKDVKFETEAAIPVISPEVETDPSVTSNGTSHDSSVDVFPPTSDSKVFNFTAGSGRRLESIKSEEEKSNDDSHNSHSHSHNSEGAVQMKKSDSFNIFKQRNDDPFADDDFFA